MNNLQEFEERLPSITIKEWQTLFDLIPKIELTGVFGENGRDIDSNGMNRFPYSVLSELIDEFHANVYKIGIVINFDWTNWTEGKEILNDSNTDFSKLDVVVLCKLITAMVRSDRFCDGALYDYFERGYILKILKALEGIIILTLP